LVLDSFTDCTTEYATGDERWLDNFWQASIYETAGYDPGPPPCISGPNTLINVLNFNGNEQVPHSFYFEKGWTELILKITERLAHLTGPLLVIPDSGKRPILVCGGEQITTLLQVWEEHWEEWEED
jgi:hypothetical protein